jgi:alkylation response protein AidB-like acyl-CoA dehydrogenase
VALASRLDAPIRFAPYARAVLIAHGDEALLLDLKQGDADPVDSSRTGWPLGRLSKDRLVDARALGAGSGELLRGWWRVALALETAGVMRGALDKTVQYVKERVQFGRPIGSFQAIPHRLAQLCVQLEGVRWLALKAAYDRADPVGAAAAATWAAATAPLVFRETQQMHGAMGFTREYPLHAWTMRLPALQRELGGLMSHSRTVAQRRWAA